MEMRWPWRDVHSTGCSTMHRRASIWIIPSSVPTVPAPAPSSAAAAPAVAAVAAAPPPPKPSAASRCSSDEAAPCSLAACPCSTSSRAVSHRVVESCTMRCRVALCPVIPNICRASPAAAPSEPASPASVVWPFSAWIRPHMKTLPPLVRHTEWRAPQATPRTTSSLRAVTCRNPWTSSLSPCPSCPSCPRPALKTVPAPVTTSECPSPPAVLTTCPPSRDGSTSGSSTGRLDGLASPSCPHRLEPHPKANPSLADIASRRSLKPNQDYRCLDKAV
mmetsp:Transcript_19505/g.56896  ORF Transcript_19505/g.56896 Transcript_19505/m.56896 type:complete len:276 (-) Transcript_19505:63-890(-)